MPRAPRTQEQNPIRARAVVLAGRKPFAGYSIDDIIAMARAQKGLVRCVFVRLLLLPVGSFPLAVLPFEMVFAYRLAAALRIGPAILLAVGMLIPLLNIALLAILSRRATKVIRAAGFGVGLMGSKMGEA
jgi:hypothetical protein